MNKIKAARIAAGLTQKQFSEIFDIPLDTIKKWDRGFSGTSGWAEKLIIKELERRRNIKKQFETKEEFNEWIHKHFSPKNIDEKKVIEKLLAEGYTDLDNLIADGHAYQIGGHTNNGWYYVDEVDIAYVGDRKLKLKEHK